MDNVSATSEVPTKTNQIRDLLDVVGEVPDLHPWCFDENRTAISAQAWSVNGGGVTSVAPMSIYLEALALPGTSFTPGSGTWTEVDLEDRGCASLVDEEGSLRLGISILED